MTECFQIEMSLSRQMKATLCKSEEIIHSAWIQFLDKRSDHERKNFKICIRKQLAILRKCTAIELQFKKKVRFCTYMRETVRENLMQKMKTSIFNIVMHPCSLSSSQMKNEVCARGVEWWPQLLFSNHQYLESQREQQIALTQVLNSVRRKANCTSLQLNKNDIIRLDPEEITCVALLYLML